MTPDALGGRDMLDELRSLLVAVGPAGLRQPGETFAGAACLVVANSLIDPEFAQFVTTGTHPASGWTSAGPASERFSAQVLDMQRRVGGDIEVRSEWSSRSKGTMTVPPWDAAKTLSWTAGRMHLPTRYLWYPVWRRSGHVFDRVTRAVSGGRPALLYVGDGWLPRHVVVVVDSDGTIQWCYEPREGNIRTLTRRQFADRELELAGYKRPSFIVIPTGRRASA